MININDNHSVCSCSDTQAISSAAMSMSGSERNLVTHQTGNLLVTLGKMFIALPAFNTHIDQNTGKMLIDIGKKLKKTKA
jgi:hypothetical protein